MQSANYDSPLTVQGNSSGEAIPVSVGTTGSSATQVQGTVAEDSAAANNPVQIAIEARASSAKTAVSSGDVVRPVGSTQGVPASVHTVTGADALTNTLGAVVGEAGQNVRFAGTAPSAFNGSTWDRVRNNTDLTVLSSAARTATLQSSDITNYNGKGLHLVIDVTAAADTPSVVFTIQGKDAVSGKYYTILASSAITGTGTTVLKVHPGITAAANASASDLLPRTWRVDATHADGDSITYSVGASVV